MNHPLLSYICCPVCKKSLTSSRTRLTCTSCKRVYPIRNGIPLLIDETSLPKHLKHQIRYFNKEDKTRIAYIVEPWQKRYVDNFLTVGVPRARGLIVDNATGSGYIALELAKLGYRVIATDLTMAELVSLQTHIRAYHLGNRILLVCANSEDLPIKTGVADGMIANAILEHLPHEKEAIQSMRRILKRGAPLMLAMPLRLLYVWPFLWGVNLRHDCAIGHLRRYSRARILRRLRGFTELKTYYTGNIVKVCCLALKLVTKDTRWDELGERLDMLTERIPYGGSNVVSILKKQ